MSLKNYELWFVTGSQHLYGPKTLEQVAANSQEIAQHLNTSAEIPVSVVFKPTVKTADEISAMCSEANNAENCIGIITWMHTFSPSKMWINGLSNLQKPFLHLHTQFGTEIPWDEIDMNYMNLNQAAHGCREYGFICSRLRLARKVVAGHWKDASVISQVGEWSRVAAGVAEMKQLKVARFGDNMRNVAVTEGDKVEAQIQFGLTVDAWGVGDLVKAMDEVSEQDIDALISEYEAEYDVVAELKSGGERHDSLRYSARIEKGLKNFLDAGGYKAFTTNFENLYGMEQLPGFAVQRLMKQGYGFGGEGDWKTAALVRTFKVMAEGLPGGTSFMEDYTYHMEDGGVKVLGAHMLEVCESIAAQKPRVEIHRLGIGGKDDPVRSLFTAPEGIGFNVAWMDMGNRFRLVCNELQVEKMENAMPKLPVAAAYWSPKPDFATSAAAWIYAGGAHHSAFTMALSKAQIQDFAEMLNLELLMIDDKTEIGEFKKEIRLNEVFYK